MNAGGLSPTLFVSGSEGGAERESLRRYLNTTLAYLGELVAGKASAKLDQGIQLGFERLRGVDSQGLAHAVKSLTDSGMSLADALETAGLA